MMAWDKTWDSLFATRPWGKYPGEDTIRFVARNFYKVKNRADVKLLEVGCGTGANLWFMAREGFSTYGVDGSAHAIEICRQRLTEEVPGWTGELHQTDIMQLNYTDNFFDAVIDIEACCCNNFEDATLIYAEMARVLKPGGKFYSRCFAKGTLGDETGERVSYNTYLPNVGSMVDTGITRFTSQDDIKNLLPTSLQVTELDQIQRGFFSGNPVIEWCITAEKNHD
ncbi:MAG: class I SAM-dependent methyltransferase [Chitinophagaceae bacterium]|nr:MAG: class I SAM-dependent methyltransferase [Chitinophagaceae bacterium]